MRCHRSLLGFLLVLTLVVPVSAKGETALMPVYGAQDAPLTFTIWGSLTCPYTGQLIPILKQVIDESNGKANMEWRHYPAHPPDPALHVYSMADPSRFWDFVFATFEMTTKHGANLNTLPMEIGKTLNIPAEKISKTQANDKLWDAVKQDFLAAKLTGVRITPGLFHDGYFLTPKGMPRDLKEFKKILSGIVDKAQI